MTVPTPPLAEAVQANCHIADARHAADLSLCVYLLQMREFFRWEQGLAFSATLDRDALGRWLASREATWSALEHEDFRPVPVPGGVGLPAHDVEAINAHLHPSGLTYGAGLAGPARPGFFLADLERREPLEGGLVLEVCGREHARGLFAPPAALQGHTIVLRMASLERWVWEKVEAHGLKRADGPMKAVVAAYPFDVEPDAAVRALARDQASTLVLHERGEYRVGQRFGSAWQSLRWVLPDRRTDLYARAIRDHLADLDTTLPALLDRQDAVAIHFWFASFDGIRATLYPGLSAGYQAWCDGDRGRALRAAMARGEPHFTDLADRMLDAYARLGDAAGEPIRALVTGADAICPA